MIRKSRFSLLLRTIKDLKSIQIYYRLFYVVAARFRAYRLQSVKTIDVTPEWTPPSLVTPFVTYSHWDKSDIDTLRFSFLNETKQFSPTIDWKVPDKGRLWRYNLHYFQYLLIPGMTIEDGVSHIRHWIRENPPGTPDAWDPFPISLRLVNCIKFFHTVSSQSPPDDTIRYSMLQQALWLEKTLEFHLLGNHLFKNGKALLFMGICFSEDHGKRWLEKGCHILEKEIHEQILPDGGHFERSPMYHTMILEDCLDILNMIERHDDPCVGKLRTTLKHVTRKMVRFLSWLSHPDGRIALFNDAAFGIELETWQISEYYSQVTGTSPPIAKGSFCALSSSGYFILSPDLLNESETAYPNSPSPFMERGLGGEVHGEKLIIDCGPVGPKYQPGHAHCDTLSFELSILGERVIVDSGCSQYEDAPIRKYNRGNAGHNTITIDNADQSQVWSAHRCAEKANPLGGECGELEDGSLWFKGGHDGYRRLKGKPIHFREIRWKGDVCKIEDRIEGQGKHVILSQLHINPDLDLKFDSDRVVVEKEGQHLLTVRTLGNEAIQCRDGWYCPEFGVQNVCSVLFFSINKKLPQKCGWILTATLSLAQD